MQDVLREVGIVVRIRSAYVVVSLTAGLRELLELRNNSVIAALSGIVHAEAVMHFLASVDTHNDVVHLFIREFNDLIVYKNAVRSKRETEVLASFLLDAAGMGDRLLYHVPVHQGLTTEEVHFQVAALARMCHQEVQRLLADFEAHQRAVAVIFALAGEAVGTVQVAGMRHMKTECLDVVGLSS